MVTGGYEGLQGVTRGQVTRDDWRLQGITSGYKGLKRVTGGYRGLQEVTGCYRCFQGAIWPYR